MVYVPPTYNSGLEAAYIHSRNQAFARKLLDMVQEAKAILDYEQANGISFSGSDPNIPVSVIDQNMISTLDNLANTWFATYKTNIARAANYGGQ